MKNLFLGLSLAAMALLAACSSGSGTNSEPLKITSNSSSESVDEYDSIVEEVGNLPKCVEGKDGEVYYVKEAGVAYTCRYDGEEETGEWVRVRKKKKPAGDDDDDQESSSSVNDADDSSSSEESEDVSPTSAVSTYDVVTGTFTDSRDGQTYRAVKIGDQVWMAENLNFVTDNSWCYNDESDNCAKYGRLYTWAAAVGRDEDECGYEHTCGLGSGDIRGACPKGWHLPSKAEWEALIVAVDGSITEYTYSNTAGSKLKSVTGWNAYSGIANEDAFGFLALPAGDREYDGSYDNEGGDAYFWSSAEGDSYGAYIMGLSYNNVNADLDYLNKSYGFSVRCLKD
jgi:uncharacterized protein (TIGR02145 family)